MKSSLTIGLVGNPNSGKTTLFNQLTGSHQRVGNWSGVTVERKEGKFSTSFYDICIVDLPGTYSLTAVSSHTSLDEQIVSQYIMSNHVDIIINVIDASNMEHNLYLTLQILELGIPCIIALNMLDIAKKEKNLVIDIQILSKLLGCPVVPIISNLGKGLNQLKKEIDRHPLTSASFYINWPEIISLYIKKLIKLIPLNYTYQRRKWLAIQILEGDSSLIENWPQISQILPTIQQELKKNKNDATLLIVNSRYQVIDKITTLSQKTYPQTTSSLSQKIDNIVLNKWLGMPIFLFVVYFMFFFSINVGGSLQPLFDIGSTALFIHGIQWLGYIFHCPSELTFFIAQGIGGGINTILPLIPQITFMYLFISVIEESGYMARAAFIMDRVMQILGLPGKSFIPLLIGFGCNVPSVMSTRTLNTSRERIITIMMVPFISCSARLTIFTVFGSAFFGKNGGTLVIFSLYILGILAAILTGIILKYTIIQGEAFPFVMELPSYHLPHTQTILIQTWQRLKDFLYKAGKVIIIASLIVSALNSFSFDGKLVKNVHESALATVSHKITPLLIPMGISNENWQAIVGLLAGTIAKEVIISTLNTLYTSESILKNDFEPATFNFRTELLQALSQTIQQLITIFSFKAFYNPIKASQSDEHLSYSAIGVMNNKFKSNKAAYSYLIFVLLYVPCASVLGAISRETNRGWMFFSIFWALNLAWSLATLFYQIATFTKHYFYSSIIIMVILLINLVIIFLLRYITKYYNFYEANY
ncbi:MAG: Fe(2+) transporter permease subunit FeoB [Candidatus Dasytiphilus stammeri]